MRTIVRNATIPTGGDTRPADIVIENDRIVDITRTARAPADVTIEADGRHALPGFVDCHSHADGLVTDPAVQKSLLRQGVTTILAGQDGISYVPGDGAYAAQYFAAIDGPRPHFIGTRVRDYLDSMSGTVPVNVAYLIPAGTVRYEVCGRSAQKSAPAQVRAMQDMVQEGMDDGAVGLSTGLDYAPNIFQDASELADLCLPVSRAGGVYVSHMRGGYEDKAEIGVSEIRTIAELTRERGGQPLPVHISHFHAEPEIVAAQLDQLEAAAIEVTFDSYPYVRGCTLLGMPLLPPRDLRPAGR